MRLEMDSLSAQVAELKIADDCRSFECRTHIRSFNRAVEKRRLLEDVTEVFRHLPHAVEEALVTSTWKRVCTLAYPPPANKHPVQGVWPELQLQPLLTSLMDCMTGPDLKHWGHARMDDDLQPDASHTRSNSLVLTWVEMTFLTELESLIVPGAAFSRFKDGCGQLLSYLSRALRRQHRENQRNFILGLLTDMERMIVIKAELDASKRIFFYYTPLAPLLPVDMSQRSEPSAGFRSLLRILHTPPSLLGHLARPLSLGPDTPPLQLSCHLGSGAYSSVWSCEYQGLGCAVKVFVRGQPQGAQQFADEVAALTALANLPCVPKLVHSCVTDPHSVLIMHPAGQSLRAVMNGRGYMDVAALLPHLLQLVQALEQIHTRLVNRDIKPHHIIDSGEHTFLVDWGMAVAPGSLVDFGGTFLFASLPLLQAIAQREEEEEERCAAVFPADDLYSLALSAVFLVNGTEALPWKEAAVKRQELAEVIAIRESEDGQRALFAGRAGSLAPFVRLCMDAPRTNTLGPDYYQRIMTALQTVLREISASSSSSSSSSSAIPAKCGARTTRGTACTLPQASCPHHRQLV